MGPDGDYQPFLVNGNGKQLPHSSPLNTTGFTLLEEEKFDLRRILTVARRRFFVIAGVAIAVTSGVAAKVLKQVPTYQGKFQLLVGSVTGRDKLDQLTKSVGPGAEAQFEEPDYETQIQVLSSPQALSGIVKKIQARYPEISYNTLRTKLSISRLQQTKILEVSYQDSDPEKIRFILQQVANGYVSYAEQAQQDNVEKGLKFVNGQIDILQRQVNKAQQDLQTLRQQNQIIDPETQGELLTNRLSASIQQRLDAQNQLSETQKLYTELQSQLAQLGVSPEQAISASALSEAPRYQQLLTKLSEVETKIATESARFTEDSPTIQALRNQQKNIMPLLTQEAATVVGNVASGVPSNPESLASSSSIRLDLTKKLVDATNQRQVLEVRQNAIAKAEDQLRQQLKDLAYISRLYTNLEQQLKGATESLNRFLTVQETLQVEKARKTSSWQRISEPEKPQEPISPNVPQGLLLGAVAGLIAGAGAAFLVEQLDKVFHSPDELKESTGLPLLGTIPFHKQLKDHITTTIADLPSGGEALEFNFGGQSHRYNASPFLEAFRSLHTNLQFISPDRPIRSMVMSSAVPADGKSTVTTFLAQASAAMGLRVLLVDADLRRPRIHETTDLPNVWGLSNVISSEINVDDVIQRSPMDENLYVLTAGQIPPDPTRLLSSKKMQSLIGRFQETFDLVIFDTPPLLGLADAKLLAAHTDGIALVVGLGKTDRSVVTEVLYGLQTSRARILGIIANGVKNYTTSTYDQYLKYYYKQPPKGKLLPGERR